MDSGSLKLTFDLLTV